MEDVKVTRLINGPEAFTPDGEFCLGETAVRGLFVAAGFCAHGLAGRGRRRQGDGRVDRRGRAVARPLAHGHPPLRRALPLAALHARPRRARSTRPTTTSSTPATSARPGRPLRTSPAYPWHAEHGAVFGEKSGWERVNWYARERGRRATRRCARAAGRACTGRPRSAPSTAPAARPPRCSTSPRSPSSRSAARARPSSSSGCATTASRARSAAITYTQMLNRRGGIECDFTVTRLEEERFGIVTGTAFGNHDLAWIRSPPARGRLGRRAASPTSPRSGRASRSGARGRATILARLHDRRPRRRGVPVHDARSDDRRRATCRCARCA